MCIAIRIHCNVMVPIHCTRHRAQTHDHTVKVGAQCTKVSIVNARYRWQDTCSRSCAGPYGHGSARSASRIAEIFADYAKCVSMRHTARIRHFIARTINDMDRARKIRLRPSMEVVFSARPSNFLLHGLGGWHPTLHHQFSLRDLPITW